MRTRNLVLPLVAAAMVVASTPAFARNFGPKPAPNSAATKAPAKVVNCDAVRKDLKLGQWPADIALQQGITLSDVKSCEAKPGTATAPPATPQKNGASGKSRDAGSKGT